MVGYDEKNISVLLHELRSPISTLLGIIEKTKVNLDSKIEVEKSLNKIEGVVSYMLSLSNNFLEISKNESAYISGGVEKSFNFREVLDFVISVFNFQFSLKNIEFIKNVADTNIDVIGDSIKIKQILINILSNCYKYTPRNGKTYLTCKYEYINEEEVEFDITVKDSGIGMSKEFLEKIFTPYNCESNEIKPTGTGLGLCIIRDNLQRMNGTIKIDSIRGSGTTVQIKFPLKLSKSNFDLSDKRILIIDDCSVMQSVLLSYLENSGATCDIACDGTEGLNKFINSPINYYHTIILDNKLGELYGYEIAKKIRNLPRIDARKVIIIGVSASSYDQDIKNCLKSGMNEYLIKPLSRHMLLNTISKQMNNIIT